MTPSPLFLVNILPAHLYVPHNQLGASQVAQKVENLPAMWGDPGLTPGLEDPLEKGVVTYSSILAWTIPWTQEPGELQPLGLQEFDIAERSWLKQIAKEPGTAAPHPCACSSSGCVFLLK